MKTKDKTKVKKSSPKAMSSDQKAVLSQLADEAKLADKERQEYDETHPFRLGVLTDEPEKELGPRLQEARRDAGLTQGELAERTKQIDSEKIGISGSVISMYERGVNRPGPREIRILCEALRISPNLLIYGEEDPFSVLTEYGRYGGWARTEAELYAAMTYCFSHLHHHHRIAIMQLMMGLLRGWNKDFDTELHQKAAETFLRRAEELQIALAKGHKGST